MRAGPIQSVPGSWLLALGALASFAVAIGYGEPPAGSESSKYARPTTVEKPQPPREPDPRQHDCPWLDDIIDDEPLPSNTENREEYRAYNYFVLLAGKFTPEQLAKASRKELTWRVLFGKDRVRYRGEIARVEGRLKRLVWIGSNKELEAQGVKNLYEAWIFGKDYFSNPTCVIVSELPEDLKLLAHSQQGEDIRDVNVTADGYYFKRYKYRAVNDTRLAPLVIGRTMSVTPPPPEEPTDPGAAAFNRMFLPALLTMVLGMVAGGFALHHWFRSGDRRAQEYLERTRPSEFIPPTDPDAGSPRGFPDEPSRN